jgi:hypothetical protein
MKLILNAGGAVGVVAAALALAAMPAQAREPDNRDQHGWQERSAESGERAHGRADPDRPAPAPQARQDQRPAQPQRDWSEGRQQQQTYTPQARQEQRSSAPQVREHWQQQRSLRADNAQQTEQRSQWNGTAQETRQRHQWTGNVQQSEPRQQWNGNAQQSERNRTYNGGDRNTTYRSNGGSWGDNRNGSDRWRRDSQNNNRHWDRSWRTNNQYDWQRYRSINRNVYHIGRYYAPYRGYSYRRLGVGFYLDSLFFGQNYWISDPFYYRLPEVYGPYRWVRYYDDALLVDIYSGEVVDVIYDFFW